MMSGLLHLETTLCEVRAASRAQISTHPHGDTERGEMGPCHFLPAEGAGVQGEQQQWLAEGHAASGWQPLVSGSRAPSPPVSSLPFPVASQAWDLKFLAENLYLKLKKFHSGLPELTMTSEMFVFFSCPNSAHGEAATPPKGIKIIKPIKEFFHFSSPRSVSWLCPSFFFAFNFGCAGSSLLCTGFL